MPPELRMLHHLPGTATIEAIPSAFDSPDPSRRAGTGGPRARPKRGTFPASGPFRAFAEDQPTA